MEELLREEEIDASLETPQTGTLYRQSNSPTKTWEELYEPRGTVCSSLYLLIFSLL